MSSCASSPRDIAVSFGLPLPSDRHVPSPWFRTTSTAYSAHRSRVYCTPKPDGVRCVSKLPLTSVADRSRQCGETALIPAARFTPFEEFPSSAAVPHHCGRCPHDVGSCRDRENAEALSSMSTRANRSSHTTSLQVPRHLGDLGRDIRSRWGSLMQNTPEGVPPWVLVP